MANYHFITVDGKQKSLKEVIQEAASEYIDDVTIREQSIIDYFGRKDEGGPDFPDFATAHEHYIQLIIEGNYDFGITCMLAQVLALDALEMQKKYEGDK